MLIVMRVLRRVGFVGAGQMGRNMAKNLLKAGFPLTIHNRTRSRIEDLVHEGARAASSPREVGESSDIVILSLTSPDVVSDIILRNDGVASGLARGGVIVDTSTIDPNTTRFLAERLRSRGVSFLDAPVSGGPEGARNATLTFMVGGERAVFEGCLDVLGTMGTNIFYMGSSGMGQATKLVNQLLVSIHTIATAEAILLARSMGLDPAEAMKVIEKSAGDSFVLRRAGRVMISRQFGPEWPTYLLHKDVGLILKTASELKLPLILPSITYQLLSAAERNGLENEDAASIITLLETLAGGTLQEKS